MPDRPSTADTVASSADRESFAGSFEKIRTQTPRLLCVQEREPSWVSLTLGLTSVGLGPPRLVWVSTAREALSRVRDEPFDCILIDVPAVSTSIRDDNSPFGLMRALRTAGCVEPVILVGRLFTDTDWIEACAHDCDVFVSARGWDSTALGGLVKRAIVRGVLLQENHRLTAADRRRLLRDHEESEKLLAQQRQFIAELESLPDPFQKPNSRAGISANVPVQSRSAATGGSSASEFAARYAGLLRSYVLMGSGSLAVEISEIADDFVAARVPPPEALQLHVQCVEDLVKGLGNRSSRHVLSRADLLAVEMMTHLAHRSQRVAGALGAAKSQAAATFSPLRNVTGTAGIDLSEQA